MLVVSSEARQIAPALPSIPMAAALKSIASDKRRKLCLHVAEARHVNAIGPITQLHTIFKAGNRSLCTALADVIHKIAPQLAAGVGQPVRKLGCGGVKENAS